MITKNITKQPKAIVEVQVTVPWADIEPKWNEVLAKMASDVELPGFRKGQAPLPMVEQNLGNKFSDEVFKTVFPAFLVEALQGSDIVPIDYPKYQLISFAKGGQLVFRAVVTQKPEVKIGDFKAISVQRPATKSVTEEDVNKLIEDLFKRWKAKNPANSTSAPLSAGLQPTANSQSAAGSMNFNGPASNAAPQPSVTNTSDSPDDNFAKAVGALTLSDLKTKIKADLENESKYNNELDFEEAILQEVEKITTVDVPEILIEDELNRMLVSLQKRVSDMGLLVEEYLKGQNETLEGLKAKWQVQAEKNVRMELGLAEIARQEKVEISDAELQTEIDKITDARLKAQFDAAEPRLHLKHSLRQMRTLDLLKTLVKVS